MIKVARKDSEEVDNNIMYKLANVYCSEIGGENSSTSLLAVEQQLINIECW